MICNMKTIARARKVGGSLVVTLPKEIVREEGISEGEVVEIEVGKRKKSGFGILRGMRSFTKEDELTTHD